MAGMLPGVEFARRRRLHHQSGGLFDSSSSSANGSSRRSSFCLYTTTHEPNLSSSFSMARNSVRHACLDEKLGEAAREAKERLDERLRAKWKSDTKRNMESAPMVVGNVNTEVFGLKKRRSKRFNWGKMRWKSSEQEECAVCLDQFKAGETLMYLPCAHRFHLRCLLPWLESNAHCPCCRMEISIQ